jgi:hypothetical protein
MARAGKTARKSCGLSCVFVTTIPEMRRMPFVAALAFKLQLVGKQAEA